MAVIVITDEQQAVIAALERAIDAGVVEGWSYADGAFAMSGPYGGSLRPAFDEGALLFGMSAAPGAPLTPVSYAALHAGFVQLLLEHADRLFDSLEITAQPCDYDVTQCDKAGRPAPSDEESPSPERVDDPDAVSC